MDLENVLLSFRRATKFPFELGNSLHSPLSVTRSLLNSPVLLYVSLNQKKLAQMNGGTAYGW